MARLSSPVCSERASALASLQFWHDLRNRPCVPGVLHPLYGQTLNITFGWLSIPGKLRNLEMRKSAWLPTSAIVVFGFGLGHAGCYTSGIPGGSGAGGIPSQGDASVQGGAGGTGTDAGGSSNVDAGGSGTGGTTTCQTNADCGPIDGMHVCLPASGTCVACIEDTDCNPAADDAGSSSQSASSASQYCFRNACLSFVPCQRTTQCLSAGASGGASASGGGAATGGAAVSVCDPVLGHCVQCSQDNDCRAQPSAPGLNCRVNRCRASCGSDLDCLKLGLLCNLALSVCTEECDTNSDCYPGYRCDLSVGKCVPKG